MQVGNPYAVVENRQRKFPKLPFQWINSPTVSVSRQAACWHDDPFISSIRNKQTFYRQGLKAMGLIQQAL